MSDPKQYYSVDTLVENTTSEEVKRRYFELKLEDEKRLDDELATLRSQDSVTRMNTVLGLQREIMKYQSEITDLRSQVERLTGERDKWWKECETVVEAHNKLIDERDQALAACAVMRETLEWVSCHDHNKSLHDEDECRFCDKIDNALSTTCGNSLLERLKELEKKNEQ